MSKGVKKFSVTFLVPDIPVDNITVSIMVEAKTTEQAVLTGYHAINNELDMEVESVVNVFEVE